MRDSHVGGPMLWPDGLLPPAPGFTTSPGQHYHVPHSVQVAGRERAASGRTMPNHS